MVAHLGGLLVESEVRLKLAMACVASQLLVEALIFCGLRLQVPREDLYVVTLTGVTARVVLPAGSSVAVVVLLDVGMERRLFLLLACHRPQRVELVHIIRYGLVRLLVFQGKIAQVSVDFLRLTHALVGVRDFLHLESLHETCRLLADLLLRRFFLRRRAREHLTGDVIKVSAVLFVGLGLPIK